MSISPLNFAIKQMINNLPATQLSEGGQATLRFQVSRGYKLLKDIWRFKGQMVVQVPQASTTARNFTIEYKADHFYRLFTNVLVSLNTNITIKQQIDLAFNRWFQVYENIGELPFINVPTSVTIPANATEAVLPVEVLIPFWYIMPDMIGSTQTFIYLNLITTMEATFKVGFVQDIISEVQDQAGAKVEFMPSQNQAIQFSMRNMIMESASDFWLVGDDYLKSATAAEVLAKMGKFFKNAAQSTTFTDAGFGQFIRLTPTTSHTLKDIWIICKDTATGKRVDNIISKIRIADGDRPLVDCDPRYLREDALERYNLSWDLYDEFNEKSPDNQGLLYGIDRVDTTFFGELINASKATANWRNPIITMDFDQTEFDKLQGSLEITVYQGYVEQDQAIQNQVNNFIGSVNSPM